MSTRPCNPDQLKLLLADQLPERQQQELSDHVAGCADCRRQLEEFAGDDGWWAEVETCLRTHANEITRQTARDVAELPDEFNADFVVEFLEPTDHPGALGKLGEYEIVSIIGRGGMGIVLKGYQPELARYVAVKVMAPHLASSGAARQRFVREARAAAAILHPHVMPIHSVCTSGRLPYLIMPFLACESLQERLDQRGALELTEILRIGMQTAQGLAASHAQGLVHRDVKPANILLETTVDRVMLVDFGLARAADDASLTRTGIVAGTPQYMSPEQACGDALDARSDLFSLGSVLYAMSTGRPPFRAESALAVLRRITDTNARSIRELNPAIPAWLEGLIARLHEKSPERRFQSAGEVAELLQQCLAHVQHPTLSPLPHRLRTTMRRPRQRWRLASVGLAALIGILAVWTAWQTLPTKPREPPVTTARTGTAPPPEGSSPQITLRAPAGASDRGNLADTADETAWDGDAAGLELLEQDVSSLEFLSRRPWDPVPREDHQDDVQ